MPIGPVLMTRNGEVDVTENGEIGVLILVLVMTTMLVIVVMLRVVMTTTLMVVVKWSPSGGACAVASLHSFLTGDWGRPVGDPIFLHIVCILCFDCLFSCCLFVCLFVQRFCLF